MTLRKTPSKTPLHRPTSLLGVVLIILLSTSLFAQAPQLSLADLLIGLRSQKVTLPERNRILTEAIRERGVTFVYTVEIAKELAATGASPELLNAIREKSLPVKPVPTPEPTPSPTPTPPDFGFYQQRGDANATKGDYTAALSDYNRAAEMRSDVPAIFIARARTHFNLKSYDRAVADYDRALELSPNDSAAYVNRGMTFERIGDPTKAIADYRKALELDTKNDEARAGIKRIEDAIAAAEAEKRRKEAAAAPVVEPAPEFVNLGTLNASNATRMVTPVYSQIAQRSMIEGKVTVELELNEKGEVTSAKATTGHQMLRSAAETAAQKSRFRPALFNNQPIKAKGIIVYNFSLKAGEQQ